MSSAIRLNHEEDCIHRFAVRRLAGIVAPVAPMAIWPSVEPREFHQTHCCWPPHYISIEYSILIIYSAISFSIE